MVKILKEQKRLLRLAGERKTTLRRELMMYQLCLILAAIGILLLALAALSGPLLAGQQITQTMEAQLRAASEQLSEELEVYEGYGLQLSRALGTDLEHYLEDHDLTMEALNDNPEALLDVQKLLYTELNTTIRLGRSSGVFALVDATVNTTLENAGHSRSGVYLRLINVSSSVILDPETIYFRGNPEIARENGLELHNRWNMEFDTDSLPGYQMLLDGLVRPPEGYYWTARRNLTGTWEDVIFLIVPLRGSTGTVYGVCGLELNAVHFQLLYPAAETAFGPMVTVVAPVEDGSILLSEGMAGRADGTWLQNTENLTDSGTMRGCTIYRTPTSSYYGLQQPLNLPEYAGRDWAAAVLIPRERCDRYILRSRVCVMSVIVGFTVVMILLALFLSKRYLRPILQSFEDIREEKPAGSYRIAELDELRRFLAEKEKPPGGSELPPEMALLLERFAKSVKTLTRAEYNIFRYYLNGYEVAQIPAAACISMSTVKKHNGNIYRKLGISSNDELMMYLDLFRRCDCLDRLEPEPPDPESNI